MIDVNAMNEEKYITIKELAELKGVSARAIRLTIGKYQTQDVVAKGGKSFEILLSSIERQEINPRVLDDLMMAQEIKTIRE